MAKQEIRTDIDGIETYDSINEPLPEFIERLRNIAARNGGDEANSFVYIEYEHDYYDGGGYLQAYIYRMETDEEEAAREKRHAEEQARYKAEHAALMEKRERAALAALKAKYES